MYLQNQVLKYCGEEVKCTEPIIFVGDGFYITESAAYDYKNNKITDMNTDEYVRIDYNHNNKTVYEYHDDNTVINGVIVLDFGVESIYAIGEAGSGDCFYYKRYEFGVCKSGKIYKYTLPDLIYYELFGFDMATGDMYLHYVHDGMMCRATFAIEDDKLIRKKEKQMLIRKINKDVSYYIGHKNYITIIRSDNFSEIVTLGYNISDISELIVTPLIGSGYSIKIRCDDRYFHFISYQSRCSNVVALLDGYIYARIHSWIYNSGETLYEDYDKKSIEAYNYDVSGIILGNC